MKKKKLETILTKTLDGLSSSKLQRGKFRKVGKKYLVKSRNGNYTSADTLEEAEKKAKE